MTADESALVDRFAAMPKSPMMEFLGFGLESWAGASRAAVCGFRPSPAMNNLLGLVHGGALAAMLDTSATAAAICASGMRAGFPTLEMKCSYISAYRSGSLTGVGKVVKIGRTIGYLEAALFADRKELIATASMTVRVIERGPAPG